VLVYSTSDERCYGVRSLRAGAAGYLMKSNGLDELLNALRIIAAGEHYFSPVIAAELIGKSLHPTPSLPSGLDTLSNREIQILRLIGMGRTTAFISKDLIISAKTVGAHRENLKNKLNAGNSASLVRKAIQLVENRFL
jgi:DNA-binding NarL/FixJ family response regulator